MVSELNGKFCIKCYSCDTTLAYTRRSYAVKREKEQAKCKECRIKPSEKTCIICKEVKAIDMFPSRGGKDKHLYDSRCKNCKYKENTLWRDNNKDKVLEYRAKDKWTLKKRCARHSITEQQFWGMYLEQEKRCKICKEDIEAEKSAIDHNHTTGEVRGILCTTCNRALGLFRDSPLVIENALDYLMLEGYYGRDK